jgi:Leucine-rich repeat (LRR) protein
LKELRGLQNLTWLDLNETRITDTGFKELSGLKNLTTLSVMSTSTTNAGVTELRKTLPTVEIYQ